MKKTIIIAVLAMILMFSFGESVIAGGGDENYNGEDGEQPGEGYVPEASENPEVGQAETDRTRNKDN